MQLSALERKDVVIAKLVHLWITNQKKDFNGAKASVELLLSQRNHFADYALLWL